MNIVTITQSLFSRPHKASKVVFLLLPNKDRHDSPQELVLQHTVHSPPRKETQLLKEREWNSRLVNKLSFWHLLGWAKVLEHCQEECQTRTPKTSGNKTSIAKMIHGNYGNNLFASIHPRKETKSIRYSLDYFGRHP